MARIRNLTAAVRNGPKPSIGFGEIGEARAKDSRRAPRLRGSALEREADLEAGSALISEWLVVPVAIEPEVKRQALAKWLTALDRDASVAVVVNFGEEDFIVQRASGAEPQLSGAMAAARIVELETCQMAETAPLSVQISR